jgi:signal transduction histidine kinase
LPVINLAVHDRDSLIKTAAGKFADDYVSTLQRHLASAGAGKLGEAHGFGKAARDAGISIRELAALHHDALLDFLLQPGNQDDARRMRAAKEFSMQALSSFERSSGDATAGPRPLHKVLEGEARRIAHALHDEASQLLACVHMALEDLGAELPDRARERVQVIRDMLTEIEQEFRRLSHELRPVLLDDLGLVPSVEFLAEGITRRSRLRITIEGATGGRLPPAVETLVYRAVQEALSNVARHARASCIIVRFIREDHVLRCSVCDDGVGFDADAVWMASVHRGLGLSGMRQRLADFAGTLEIRSHPGGGTKLLITVPLEAVCRSTC